MSRISSYTFSDGRAMITLDKRRKYYVASVWVDDRYSKKILHKDVKGIDKEKTLLRAMNILKDMLDVPIEVALSDGEELGFNVPTEDERIREFAKNFVEEINKENRMKKEAFGRIYRMPVSIDKDN